MAQQTAVEWLIEQLIKMDKELDGRRKNEDATVLKLNPIKLFEQAKEMEKDQICEAWKNGNLPTNLGRVITEEEYYNEKYNK